MPVGKFKLTYTSHILKFIFVLCATVKLLKITAIHSELQHIKISKTKYIRNDGIVKANYTNEMNDLIMSNTRKKRDVDLSILKHQTISNKKHMDKTNNNNNNRTIDFTPIHSKITSIQQRFWNCSFSFNDWCAVKINFLIEKRCVLLKQLKEILELLKTRKSLLSQLGYNTKLVDLITYFIFMNDHIRDVNEQLSKVVYSTSVFGNFASDWNEQVQDVIDKYDQYAVF